jgi:folylpolyglutamate synthase/dihydropteroate synthase
MTHAVPVLQRLGIKEDIGRLKVIHVAGTKGKVATAHVHSTCQQAAATAHCCRLRPTGRPQAGCAVPLPV